MKNRRSRPFRKPINRSGSDGFVNGNNSSRVRGNLSTVLEKYKVLAKDAAASGDHIGAENYLQHAEHYSRMINERHLKSVDNEKSSPSKTQPDVDESEPLPSETLDPAKAIEEANS